MDLIYRSYLLQFVHPFGVSSNTRKETASVFVRLDQEGYSGYGEACLPAYLGESVEETIRFLELAIGILKTKDSSHFIVDILTEVDQLLEGHHAAKAAIDIALHDLFAKMRQQSFIQMMNYPFPSSRPTSFTIGIDKEEVLEEKIKSAAAYSVLKIKAGTDNDKHLIKLIRRYTDKPLYVDVNQGWKDKEEVLDLIYWMKEQGVILIEQPLPVNMRNEMCWITERSPIVTIADESVKRLSDLQALEGSFSGVNIKLMKCTGLAEAIKMIDYCKKNNLRILLGCMAESSCATTAMAQLMSFADYVDLDAPQLYKNDPFKGLSYQEGKINIHSLPGIGVEPMVELF